MMENYRHQHAVGQGFFHTAELREDGLSRLRYVYDCGAMKKYAAARDVQIDSYVKSAVADPVIDILFLSHVHYDHVSGVERLLASETGLNVDTIVLPLLSEADRLIAYARAVGEEPKVVDDEFYRALVADPAAALSGFGPRQILFVSRGDPEGGAPGGGGADEPDDRDHKESEIYGRRGERGFVWKLAGSGQYKRIDPIRQANDGTTPSVQVAVIDDTLAFAMMTASATHARGASAVTEWLLAPFVDPTVEANRRKFIKALAKAMSMKVPDLEVWLKQVSNVQDLIVNGLHYLVKAYGVIAPDFNITSLCLYSGPRSVTPAPPQTHYAEFGAWCMVDSKVKRIAWLATGDAALKPDKRAAAFSKHYGQLLNEVATLTLPHHGSDYNLNSELIKSIGASFFVAAADKYSNWKHPGPKTVQAVADLGRFVSNVTSASVSEVVETVTIS